MVLLDNQSCTVHNNFSTPGHCNSYSCTGGYFEYGVFKNHIAARVLCVFSSHSFWTSSSLDVPAGVTQEEGHTGFFIHLPSAVRVP